MSFNGAKNNIGYKPGYFLADAEHCTRRTATVLPNHAAVVTQADGSKYVPAGAVIPANGSTAEGILYEPVDVSTGAMPGSIVTEGVIYGDRLPAALDSDAAAALTGIKVITAAPAINRPNFQNGALIPLSVASAAGTAAGDTAITVTGYTKAANESYKYKVATGTAPAAALYEVLDGTWTAWNGTSDITAATDKKITIAVVDATGAVIAAGSATVTAKA